MKLTQSVTKRMMYFIIAITIVGQFGLGLKAEAPSDTLIKVTVDTQPLYVLISPNDGHITHDASVGSIFFPSEDVPRQWWQSPFASEGAMKWYLERAKRRAIARVEANDFSRYQTELTQAHNELKTAINARSIPYETDILPPWKIYQSGYGDLPGNAEIDEDVLKFSLSKIEDILQFRPIADLSSYIISSTLPPNIDNVLEAVRAEPQFKNVNDEKSIAIILENLKFLNKQPGWSSRYRLSTNWSTPTVWLPNNIELIRQENEFAMDSKKFVHISYGRNTRNDECIQGSALETYESYWKNEAIDPRLWDLNDREFLRKLGGLKVNANISELESVRQSILYDGKMALDIMRHSCSITYALRTTIFKSNALSSKEQYKQTFLEFYKERREKLGQSSYVITDEEISNVIDLIVMLENTRFVPNDNVINGGTAGWLAGELYRMKTYYGNTLRSDGVPSRLTYTTASFSGRQFLWTVKPNLALGYFSIPPSWSLDATSAMGDLARGGIQTSTGAADALKSIEASAALRIAQSFLASYSDWNSLQSAIETATLSIMQEASVVYMEAKDIIERDKDRIDSMLRMAEEWRYGYIYVPDVSVVRNVFAPTHDYVKAGQPLISVSPRYVLNIKFVMTAYEIDKKNLKVGSFKARFRCPMPPGDAASGALYGKEFSDINLRIGAISSSSIGGDQYTIAARVEIDKGSRKAIDPIVQNELLGAVDGAEESDLVSGGPIALYGAECEIIQLKEMPQ